MCTVSVKIFGPPCTNYVLKKRNLFRKYERKYITDVFKPLLSTTSIFDAAIYIYQQPFSFQHTNKKEAKAGSHETIPFERANNSACLIQQSTHCDGNEWRTHWFGNCSATNAYIQHMFFSSFCRDEEGKGWGKIMRIHCRHVHACTWLPSFENVLCTLMYEIEMLRM